MSLSSLDRRNTFQHFKAETYDLLVIGGGITGAGIALDAVTRGMKVALVDMQDFAAGTSSRSTKLVHGGLRYLKNLQIKVVASSGRERAIVYENGPHVTTPERMLLPMHKGGTFGKFSTSIGLRVYDYLAGVKKDERRTMLTAEETLEREPLIKSQDLKGGGSYVEYRTDDARLTIEVIKKAVSHGAHVINYVNAISFNYDDHGQIEGALVQDLLSQNMYIINAKQVVNASGPWVEKVRDYVKHDDAKSLLLTKGVHLVVDQQHFPLKQAVYFDTEKDNRMIFAIPRDGKAYVGTTDTVYKDDRKHPKVSATDRQYIIDAINYMFPSVKITDEQIESSWAGVRPLIREKGKSPSEVSRKDEVWTDPSGLLTIAGGKLTGYRHMAEEVVDKVAKHLVDEYRLEFKECITHHEPISGGDVGGSDNFEKYIDEKVADAEKYNLTKDEARALTKVYGSNIDDLFEIASKAHPENMEGMPLDVYTRLMYALRYEAAVTPCDFFIRRTSALFFNIQWVNEHKISVIKFMARYFGWNSETIKKYNAELETAIYEATHSVEDDGIIKLDHVSKKDADLEAPANIATEKVTNEVKETTQGTNKVVDKK